MNAIDQPKKIIHELYSVDHVLSRVLTAGSVCHIENKYKLCCSLSALVILPAIISIYRMYKSMLSHPVTTVPGIR